MENFFSRYRNASLLVLLLFAEILGLAVQVKRPETGGTRLLRFWVVNTITPLEKGLVGTGQSFRNVWRNYLYLRGVRRENRDLKGQIEHLRLEQVRLGEDAAQARRLQALFAFKEQFISQTVAAQVIGTSGSDQQHVVYIDKGWNDGVKPDMAVITPDGIVGKVLRVYHASAQVLLINDPDSGVGAIVESSRLQGILRGTAAGETMLRYVMSDEKVATGERVLTSGGDRIFPKGLPIGTVQQTNPGSDLFLNIRVKPAADLSRLEEVLVVTRIVEHTPQVSEPSGPVRAADVLAERLPSVPPKPPAGTATGAAAAQTTAAKPPSATATAGTPSSQPAAAQSPHSQGGTPNTAETKPAAKPSGSAPIDAGTRTTDAATKSAATKPVASKPAANGESRNPRQIKSAGQPVKPGDPPAQSAPGEEVSR